MWPDLRDVGGGQAKDWKPWIACLQDGLRGMKILIHGLPGVQAHCLRTVFLVLLSLWKPVAKQCECSLPCTYQVMVVTVLTGSWLCLPDSGWVDSLPGIWNWNWSCRLRVSSSLLNLGWSWLSDRICGIWPARNLEWIYRPWLSHPQIKTVHLQGRQLSLVILVSTWKRPDFAPTKVQPDILLNSFSKLPLG